MKDHPETIILIEPATRKLWRVVERVTTQTGFSSDEWSEIEGNLPSYPVARSVFDSIKQALRVM